jgi:biotin operon repressor
VDGTLQRTSHGLVEVIGVRQVEESEIDAGAAGFATNEEVLAGIRPPETGRNLYEIRIRWAGTDPRLELRESSDLDEAALDAIDSVVSGIGRHGGPSGIQLLKTIAANPATLAQDLADGIGVERDVLKRRIRQLKEIGLTESLRVGYRLSPRGKAYLERRSDRK